MSGPPLNGWGSIADWDKDGDPILYLYPAIASGGEVLAATNIIR